LNHYYKKLPAGSFLSPLRISSFTATILEWKYLLKPDKYKDIIIGSLKFLVKEKMGRDKCFCPYE